MAEFDYTALRADGSRVHGQVEARDANAAEVSLRHEQLYVLRLRAHRRRTLPDWLTREISLGQGLTARELAVWSRQLSTLIQAGVPIVESLRIQVKQTHRRGFRQALETMVTRIESGDRLSQAMAEQRTWFPPLVHHLIVAAEISGTLSATLDRLAQHFELAHRNQEKIKSAMAYPLVVGVASIGVTLFVMVRIVPTFVSAFAGYGARLPLATRLVLAISHFLTHYGWMVGVALGAIWVGDRWAGVRRQRYRKKRAELLLWLPIIGELNQKQVMADMTRTMSLLLESATPIVEGLDVVRDVVDNAALTETLTESRTQLQAGRRWSEVLAGNRWIPPMVSEMISVGEQTGSLDQMLGKVADLYETEVSTMVERLQSLIEPVMILFLAIVVGLIVVAVMAPDFQLLRVIH